jgi:hypothetical protein
MTHNSTNGADQGMGIAPDDAPTPRTPGEIETLKASWLSDGCWDIEETEGFEYHYQELRQWREAHNAEWDRKERERVTDRGAHLGFTYAQMRYFEGLELRIRVLERENEQLRDSVLNGF